MLTNTRSLELCAASNEEAQRWIRVLQQTANMALGAPDRVEEEEEVEEEEGGRPPLGEHAASRGDGSVYEVISVHVDGDLHPLKHPTLSRSLTSML